MYNQELKRAADKLADDFVNAIEKIVKPGGHVFGYEHCVVNALGFQAAEVKSICWTSGYAEGAFLMVQMRTLNREENQFDSTRLDDLELSDLIAILEALPQE